MCCLCTASRWTEDRNNRRVKYHISYQAVTAPLWLLIHFNHIVYEIPFYRSDAVRLLCAHFHHILPRGCTLSNDYAQISWIVNRGVNPRVRGKCKEVLPGCLLMVHFVA